LLHLPSVFDTQKRNRRKTKGNLMANTKSSKARILTNRRDDARNRTFRTELKTLISLTKKAIEKKDAKIQELLNKTVSRIDSAVSKGMLKKETASRKKARLLASAHKATKK